MKLLEGDIVIMVWQTAKEGSIYNLLTWLVQRGDQLLVETRVKTGERKTFLEIPPQPLSAEADLIGKHDQVHREAAEHFQLETDRVEVRGGPKVLVEKLQGRPWFHVMAVGA